MAAARPAAVAINASEIPGATTARVADPLAPMPLKVSMIPQTVPKSPIKGLALPLTHDEQIEPGYELRLER